MNLFSEADLISIGKEYGQKFAKQLAKNHCPIIVELVGDVGAGKTTFTRGLAEGLGIINGPVTSPSFTICKRYFFPVGNDSGTLSHYDFYRLDDPGLMAEDLAEIIATPFSVTVIEWGQSVANVLPKDRITLYFTINDDSSRTIKETK
ncbi:tRNA (adenosine(37)-N6)-threonylcarbamoyltransferase complex ATPase subunit type 1 TsaE [Candidatus Saccharibacteria bacterium]|nr:tRNA (adenosine(37)-N6)-threonylcarbamoyltransferase complex ATPase subunit type 1 TsaE [Candidatus Saccharibacteria bacterium]